MEGHVNSYTGMNKDMGRDSIPNNLYIDALDIRISTTTGESMGSFTNMEGNEESFTIPVAADNPLPFGLWTADNPEIIGYTTIRDRIILFVADDSNTKGWIYEVRYNTANRQILAGYDPRLIYYNDSLNFNKAWPIEALGRYESDCIQRIYWTDYNNFLRALNIEDPELVGFSAGLLDIVPDVSWTQPILQTVSGGGSLLSGLYQVAYRLITPDGKQTLVSPPSNMIHIVTSDENGTQSAAYVGEVDNAVNTGKSLTIEVDTSNYGFFDKIEFIVFYYDSPDADPDTTSVETQLISGNTATFVFTGDEGETIPIELLEASSKNVSFKTPKTIAQKDNYLVAANIKGSSINVDDLLEPGDTFSALTRRYNAAGATPFPIGSGNDQDDLDNAFNISTSGGGFGYNSDAHWNPDWHTNRQYRYQSDLTTLGGQGPNISYKFHLEPMSLDADNQAGFNNISNVLESYDNHDLNDDYGIYPNTSFPTNASPANSGLLKGYKRGEVYRFGIVFYTIKGEATFVEYIGDIKFPDISEQDGASNLSGTNFFPLSRQNSSILKMTIGYNLGIQFTLDFTSCPGLESNITGYQIVRLKRTETDKKRIAQGIIKNTAKQDIDPAPLSGGNFDFQVNGSNDVLHFINTIDSTFNDVLFRQSHSIGRLVDHENLNPTVDGVTYNATVLSYPAPAGFDFKSQYLGFYCPEISFKQEDTISNLTSTNLAILGTGLYLNTFDVSAPDKVTAQQILKDISTAPIELGEFTTDFRQKTREVEALEYNKIYNIRKLKRTQYFNMDESTNLNSNDQVTSLWDTYYVRNYFAYGAPDVGGVLNRPNDPASQDARGVASKSGSNIVIQTERFVNDPLTGTSIPNVDRVPLDNFYLKDSIEITSSGTPVDGLASVDTTYPEDEKLLIADIVSTQNEQYGGFTQNALETNVFIIASPVIQKTTLNPIVFGGDIFINMYTLQTQMVELNNDLFELGGVGTSRNKYYKASTPQTELFAVESTINMSLQTGSNLKTGVGYQFNGSGDQEILRQENNNTFTISGKSDEMYKYNFTFSRENTDIALFVSEENQDEDCTVNDVRTFLSNLKVNNEEIDSWTKFGANVYYDIDDYGPINKIINYRDTVYFLQDRAVGVYAINRTAITTTVDGTPTELGNKDGFSKHNYISKENGTVHQWAVQKTSKGIYFFDAINRKIFLLGPTQSGSAGNTPLSELKGMHSFVQLLPDGVFLRKEDGGDNPILGKGVHIGKDGINDEVIFTFLGFKNSFKTAQIDTEYFIGDIVLVELNPLGTPEIVIITSENFTTTSPIETAKQEIRDNSEPYDSNFDWRITNQSLVFDELLQSFSTRLSQTPTIWINNNDILLSPHSQTEGFENVLYTHNIGNYGEFYGNIVECELTLVVNPKVDFNKILRFLEFNSIVRDESKIIDRAETITGFRIQTEYQDSGVIPYSAERFKRRFDKWRIKLPRDINSINQKGRFRSTYFIVTLYFDNQDNKQLIMNHLLSYYNVQVY